MIDFLDAIPDSIPALPCFINGRYTTVREAQVSVLDRGFIFGDGVYEVVPVYAGKVFCFEEHLARLGRSLKELRMPNPLSQEEWRTLADRLIADYALAQGKTADQTDQLVYIQITRGVAMRDHVMPEGIPPTVFVMSNKMSPPSQEQRQKGVFCVTADDFRWQKAHIKSTSLLGSVLARQISFDAGAVETIMFRNGFLSEAAACNVWVAKDAKLLGAPKDHLVLQGIRYGLIERLCAQAGIGFELRRISKDEVLTADEVLLSSATKEVLPVTRIDDRVVGTGVPGPIYAQLHALYQTAKAKG